MQTDQRYNNLYEEMIKGDTLTAPAEHFYDRQPANKSTNYRNRSQEGRPVPTEKQPKPILGQTMVVLSLTLADIQNDFVLLASDSR